MDERPRNRRQWSDSALLSAIAARDGAAFAVFYRRHLPPVLAFLLRETRDHEAAADLAAEVFAAVLLSAGRYHEQGGSATPWVIGIADNKLLMSFRRGRVEARARGTWARSLRPTNGFTTRPTGAIHFLTREVGIGLTTPAQHCGPISQVTSLTAPPRPGAITLQEPGAMAAGSPKRLWLAALNNLYESGDGGARWSRVPGPDPQGSPASFDVLSPTRAWLLAAGQGLWRTTDGRHWSAL